MPVSRRSLLALTLGFGAAATLSRPARATPGILPRPGLQAPALPLPPRLMDAPTGSSFARRVTGLSDAQRYAAAVDEVLAGNVPSFLRPLSPVTLLAPDGHWGPRSLTIFVTPDYLAVGTARDFLRVPLDLPGAARVARELDLALPTPKIVDAIFAAATTRVAPAPLPPTAQMRSMPYVLRHQGMVEAARAGHPIIPLMAGHKKDLVITNRLRTQPERVAIYGWHQPDGKPIQPLSLVHGKGYADYSHGIRLLHRMVLVEGRAIDLFAALEDPALAPMLTREGSIPRADELLAVV